ncbi:MAG: hypothetical protein NT080_14135 [Spirochaetes bacterium]|nr:hypothetical protein [Spirochaetota bacterium]
MKRLQCITFALLCAAAAITAAQSPEPVDTDDTGSTESIFAPFPSRIRVVTRGLTVIVAWEDSADIEGDYAIYRYGQAIDASNFGNALFLGSVPIGSMSFEDNPPDPKAYYYLVLGRDAKGLVYEVFVPLKNATMMPISVAVPEKPKGVIESISATRRNDAIVLLYVVSKPGDNYVLYRHIEPILSVPKLLESTIVALFEDTAGSFVDYPVPGISYFYALVEEKALTSGEIKLEAGVNATTTAVVIPTGLYRTGLPAVSAVSRNIPLPYLSLNRSVGTDGGTIADGIDLPEPRQLTIETEKALRRYLAGIPSLSMEIPRLRVFQEDLKPAAGAEDYTLGIIARDKLQRGVYVEAADHLIRYLSIQRTPNAAARAHFYRGEALAFSGSLRDAFFEFLLAEDRYYVESNEWINYILEKLNANPLS